MRHEIKLLYCVGALSDGQDNTLTALFGKHRNTMNGPGKCVSALLHTSSWMGGSPAVQRVSDRLNLTEGKRICVRYCVASNRYFRY